LNLADRRFITEASGEDKRIILAEKACDGIIGLLLR
jgi:hypothetical protein